MITHGYHGTVGNQFVLKVQGGKSVLAARPDRGTVVLTQAQKNQCKQFTNATQYAKNALLDPVLGPVYRSRATKDKSAYNVAVGDFLTKPWIDQIDATAYSGLTGEKISVIAADNIKVSSVMLSILDPAGAELERGACVFEAQSGNWIYTASSDQVPVTGNRVLAVVKDLPGHVTERELVL